MNRKPGTDIEALVRARAHKIWIEEGQPEGRSEHHWQRAQDELHRELSAAKPAKGLSEPSASPDAGLDAKRSTKSKAEAPRKRGPAKK